MNQAISCRDASQHTLQPAGYLQWHAWAEHMMLTHTCHRCRGCGLFKIWRRRLNRHGRNRGLNPRRGGDRQFR